jgi:exopolyphosphatase/guanosine-5'-triphosphate,3'-diphosphate pyrophosphatase
MPYDPPAELPRSAVVDLGSNSVRLVVFEGCRRNPVAIFNEKAVLRLGRGLTSTGTLDQDAVAQAVVVLERYHAIARAMGAEVFEVLGTAAVREAENGPDFVDSLRQRMPGVPIHVLSGEEEAALSADGVLSGIPEADGVLADIGGGSLELVPLHRGRAGIGHTLRLGVIRLAERSGGDMLRAREIAQADLATQPWLGDRPGGDLYLVGGAFRALAHMHMVRSGYPLLIVHHYELSRDVARDLAGEVAAAGRRALERLPGVSRRRIDDLPFAAVVLRRVLRATGARRVIFSANGLREGWLMRRMPAELRAQDPLLAAGQDYARRLGRDPALPPSLLAWTAPLFDGEGPAGHRLREAACWMSDIGSRDHPDYRAEQAFLRVLRQPGMAQDHATRAFLALTLALRYEAEADAAFLAPARALLDAAATRRAEVLGVAMRLAYTLSAGTPELLARTALTRDAGELVLHLAEGGGVFAGESIVRRLERLASVMGLTGRIEVG